MRCCKTARVKTSTSGASSGATQLTELTGGIKEGENMKQILEIKYTKELTNEECKDVINRISRVLEDIYPMIFSTIDSHPVERVVRWRRVEDELPEGCGSYLVYAPESFSKNSPCVVAEFYDDNNTFYSESSDNPMPDVTHWMPLPEKPST